MKELKRGAGILLAITSLPSKYGIGTVGIEAYHFVDMLIDLKQKYWQVLPVGPTGLGDSPYQSFSAFAGNPYMIDLDALIQDGLLKTEDVDGIEWGNEETNIDYAVVFENRFKVLHKAYSNFDTSIPAFLRFCDENAFWLRDYSLFMAIKELNNYSSWTEWETGLREHDAAAINDFSSKYNQEIGFWCFLQYCFFTQWSNLKAYTNARGIEIIGEVPFYISCDSADVWAHRELFHIDSKGFMAEVAGYPPDALSTTGQIWGNPLYDWACMEKNGFSWWSDRISINAKIYDVIRINHFVGIVKYYAVPSKHKDAKRGKWHKGPGKKLADVIVASAGDTTLIAEDFGTVLIPAVKKLKMKLSWAGMKVLLFAFDQDPKNPYLPHNYEDSNSVVYGTTHDSDTVIGYFANKSDYQLAYLYEYLGINDKEQIPDAFIRLAYSSVANVVILQMQDILKLGNEARMNHPSTVGSNWRWRLWHDAIPEDRRNWLRTMASIYRR